MGTRSTPKSITAINYRFETLFLPIEDRLIVTFVDKQQLQTGFAFENHKQPFINMVLLSMSYNL